MGGELRALALVVLAACAAADKGGSGDSGTSESDTDTDTDTDADTDADTDTDPGTHSGCYYCSDLHTGSWDTACSHTGYGSDGSGSSGYVCGRPLDVGGVRRAEVGPAPSWAPALEVDAPADRAAVAAAWRQQGLDEHASVGSFARFTLDLLAVGAPPDLLAEAQRAAGDEVEHARLCFAIARAMDGRDDGPGPLRTPPIPTCTGLAELAVRTFLEGCLNETLAAAIALAQRSATDDPATASALDVIAADEGRHAALAWRTVAWALQVGGDDVRAAVAAAWRGWSCAPPATGRTLTAHGLLSDADAADVVARARRTIVEPAVRALRLA